MPFLRLPTNHDTSYPPPRGPALLLSCMDLRLLDEIVQFMDHDGLANRYDHVILAGAALGALGVPGAKDGKGDPVDYSHWKKVFRDHLAAAYSLHHIKDVYILEHRDCGAYREYIGADFDDHEAKEEAECHLKYAKLLEAEIKDWATRTKIKLRVKSFLMDLRGGVTPLVEPQTQTAQRPKRSRKAEPGSVLSSGDS